MTIGNVYFLENGGFIKIGFAKDVAARMRSLSTSMPKAGNLIAAIPGSKKFEHALHVAASSHRERGEWFKDCDEVRRIIDAVISGGPKAIGFTEPPELEAKFDHEMSLTFSSPLAPAFERVNACLEKYMGPHVTDKKRRRQAGGIISRSLTSLERLTAPAISTVFEENPIDQASLLPKAEKIASSLEKRLSMLAA